MVILPLLCKGPYRVAFLLQIAADQMVYFRKKTISFSISTTQMNSAALWCQSELALSRQAKNNYHKGKDHCTVDLLFDWFGFGQTSKTADQSTLAKPNKQ